ncbi:MAG: hypothetical protein ACRDWI_00390 [Jiangellaceae bacterium]
MTRLPRGTYAEAGVARATFLTRIWSPPAGRPHLGGDDVAALAVQVYLERYAAGEVVQREGVVSLTFQARGPRFRWAPRTPATTRVRRADPGAGDRDGHGGGHRHRPAGADGRGMPIRP